MQFSVKEVVREQEFGDIWYQELDEVFADVARYYDRANHVASLGLWNYFRDRFQSTIEVRPGQQVLDVCAGTNAVGIALLQREPTLKVHAIDRSAAMQEVGRARAQARGLHIGSTIGDVHRLPFPAASFDVVTLQWASRHLRVMDVFREIHRVLRPGGHFYHCDMERPDSRFVELAYSVICAFARPSPRCCSARARRRRTARSTSSTRSARSTRPTSCRSCCASSATGTSGSALSSAA